MDSHKMPVCTLNHTRIERCAFLNFFLSKVLYYFNKKILEYVHIYYKLNFGHFCIYIFNLFGKGKSFIYAEKIKI